uniref:JmjC domain-containing protein n=1 Tax=Tanacetum cinerariifolium TaxID=118510 RepID=A0A699IRI9_TANCI|nr:hypothetical protein [Tanacetum cinerariifolium]
MPKLYTKVKSDFGQPSSGSPFQPPFSNRNELVDHPIVGAVTGREGVATALPIEGSLRGDESLAGTVGPATTEIPAEVSPPAESTPPAESNPPAESKVLRRSGRNTIGKAVATPSLPVTAPTAKELADQKAAIFKAERQELLEQELKQNMDAEQVYLDSLLAQRLAEEQDRESMASAVQSTQRQAELDRVALNLTNEEWIGLVDQVRADPTLSAKLLGADVSKDTFSVRMVELMNRRRKIIAEMKAKAKREKPMTLAQQKEFMRTFVKNQKLQETTSISAGATIATGDPIPTVTSFSAGFSVSDASSIPAATPIVVGVSTTAGASGSASEAFVPVIELFDSPPKDTSLPLDPETDKLDEPLRKSSRKKSITRKRTLPSPSKPKFTALLFDKDDPEATFKKADGTVKRSSTLRELMYWAGRADMMVLYGLVSDKYKTESSTGIGLGLWMDLRILITSREERDASITWDDQDQWQI